jgi:hypothetical protein
MHHAPVPRLPGWQWLDGLREHASVCEILEAHDHVHVLHGHTHTAVDRAVRPGATPRIFSPEAVVDGSAPLRLYTVRHGRLWLDACIRHPVPSLVFA